MFRARELAARREALVARCAGLRAGIASHGAPLGAKLNAADRMIAAIRVHPLLAGAAAAALAGIVPRVMPAWMTRGLLLYSVLKRL